MTDRQSGLGAAARNAKKSFDSFAVTCLRLIAARRANTRVFVVLGMRQAGNQLLIDWLRAQRPGPFFHYNNIPPDQPPFKRKQRMSRMAKGGRTTLVLSYEDATLEEILRPPLVNALERYGGYPSPNVHLVLLVRDPYNLFASRATKWPHKLDDPEKIALWRRLFRDNATTYLDPASSWANLIRVSYNRFVREVDYRRTIADELGLLSPQGREGLPNPELALLERSAQREIPHLDTHTEWLAWHSDARYQSLFEDPSVRELGERIFGPLPPSADAESVPSLP